MICLEILAGFMQTSTASWWHLSLQIDETNQFLFSLFILLFSFYYFYIFQLYPAFLLLFPHSLT